MDKKDLRLTIFLGIFSIIIFFVGFLQIRGAIYAPFNFSFNRNNSENITEEEWQEEINEELSQKDTDGDGLSDFDEKFIHQTSIFLFDSDGDSFSDKEEIDAGSDLLNPESTPYREPKPEEENILDEEGVINEQEEISSEEIRNLLINQGGMSKEIVDNLDDKTLIKLYNETKQETGISLEDLGILNKEEISQFSNLSALEIREMLINAGVDEEILETIDDQTLMQLLQESLSSF